MRRCVVICLVRLIVLDRGGGVGVDSAPAGISRSPKHGVVCLDLQGIGSVFCGGCVGANGIKMCVKSDCTLKSHQVKARGLFIEGLMVFIQGPASKGAQPTTVFSAPAIPRSAFASEAWATGWSVAQKSLEAWQVSFTSLTTTDGQQLGVEASLSVCDRTTASKLTYAVTPRKRYRSPAAPVESPGMTVALESPLLPMLDNLGPSEAVMMSALGPAWQTLAENMKSVERIARAAHSRAKEGESATQEDLEQVDLKLAALHSLLGDRPPKFGTQTAFEALTEVMELFDEMSEGLGKNVQEALVELREGVAEGISARLNQIVSEQIRAQVFGGRFYTEFVVPATALIHRCSPGPDKAGDLWEDRLANLERELGSMKKASRGPSLFGAWEGEQMEVEEPAIVWGRDTKANVKKPPVPGVFGQQGLASSEEVRLLRTSLCALQQQVAQQAGSMPPGHGQEGLAGHHSSLSAAESRVTALEQAVKELKNQSQRSGVTIMPGYSFDSADDVRVWMAKYGVEQHVHMFVDPLSLLALSDSLSVSEEAASAARVLSAKIGETTDMTKYRASFLVEIPPILGKKMSPSSFTSDKQLAAIPKHTDWNTGTGADGVSDRMTTLLDMGERNCNYQINGTLSGEPNTLATKLLSLSRNHWDRITSWMTLYHSEVGARSHATKDECWLLVTSCIRTILTEAHMARLPGRNGSPHDMLWGTLQAHAFFVSLTAGKIQGHPKVAVILQGHVVDHSTPIALHRALALQVTELTKAVGATRTQADRVAQATAAAKNAN